MQELQYHRPATAEAAVALLARSGARALAGGTDLIAQLREGRRAARDIVDLKHVAEFNRITRSDDGGYHVGAAVSIGRLGQDLAFAAAYPGVLASARLIGSLQIQNRATLVGNLCNAAPSADAVPLLVALGANVEILSSDGRRRHTGVEAIAKAPGQTSLMQGDLVTALLLPPVGQLSATCYLRFTPRREMDIAVAGSGVVITLGDDGAIRDASIVLASVGPTPLRASGAAMLLIGQRPAMDLFAAAGAKAANEAQPISDTRGSADYRRELVAVLTRRALEQCARQLGVLSP